jgi:hypothetical protein
MGDDMRFYSIRTMRSIAVAGAILLPAISTSAFAAKLRFGDEDTLTVYAETNVRAGADKLSLCYKATTFWLLAGVYTTGEVVLCNQARTRYWPLPTGDKLAELQRAGQIANPVPTYERPVIEYIFGYSLWILIGGLAVGGVLGRHLRKTSAVAAGKRIRVLAKRIIAEVIDARPEAAAAAHAAAHAVYESAFGEALDRADFDRERSWIRSNLRAYHAYFEVVAKRIDAPMKDFLLRIAATLTVNLGRADEAGWVTLIALARRLGVGDDAVGKIIEELSRSRPST